MKRISLVVGALLLAARPSPAPEFPSPPRRADEGGWSVYHPKKDRPKEPPKVETPEVKTPRQEKEERQAVREVIVAVQTAADAPARAEAAQSAPPELRASSFRFKSQLLDDLQRRAEYAEKGGTLDSASRWDEKATTWTNKAWSERSDSRLGPPTVEPRRDTLFQKELDQRKEKGVRIFVDPRDLEGLMRKREAKGLELLQEMETELLSSHNPFESLRRVGRRCTWELAGGRVTAKLGFARMPWSGNNESMIAVSLRNLMSRLDQEKEPTDETLRLARLKRILGYLVDPDLDDVVLIGVPADASEEPALLLDDLTIALRTCWVEDKIPGCSLDPDPSAKGGKQHSRVFGVPRDSNLAKVMLDADYEMKRIDLGLSGFDSDPIPGFRSWLQLLVHEAERNPEAKLAQNCRSWLSPMRPVEGDIHVEPGRGLVLFQSRIQILTEMLALNAGVEVGLGKADPIDAAAAAQFTAYMDEIEKRRTVFQRLHAVFDLVMLCQLLRQNGIQSSLLKRIAARTTRPVEVKEHYEGLGNERILAGQNAKLTVQGGVMIYLKYRRQYLRELERKELQRLETAILDGMTGREVSLRDSRAMQDLLRDRQQADREKREADASANSGLLSFLGGDYEKAERSFTKALDWDPLFVEAYCQRGIARIELRKYREAEADGSAAIRIDPEFWTGYWVRCVSRRSLGRTEDAEADLRKYRELVERDELLKAFLRKRE